MHSTRFLRRILGLDALSCLAMGLLVSLAALPLAALFGLPESLLRGAALLLLPLAAFIGWLASRAQPPAFLVWVVIVGNLGWAAKSFITIEAFGDRITAVGTAFVAAQALTVLTLALLEWVGLRRIGRPAVQG